MAKKGEGGGKGAKDDWRSEIKWDDRSCMAKKEDYIIAHGEQRVFSRTPPPSFFLTKRRPSLGLLSCNLYAPASEAGAVSLPRRLWLCDATRSTCSVPSWVP